MRLAFLIRPRNKSASRWWRLAQIGINGMSKLYQITEPDLADLEQTLPQLADALTLSLDNAMRIKIRRVQAILSRVRWSYGPWTEVGTVPAQGD
jgi:hypothetical protein